MAEGRVSSYWQREGAAAIGWRLLAVLEHGAGILGGQSPLEPCHPPERSHRVPFAYPQMSPCCNPSSPSLKAALGMARHRVELRAASLHRPGGERDSGEGTRRRTSPFQRSHQNNLLSSCKGSWAPSSHPCLTQVSFPV